MTKEKLALEIIERLKREYPQADCTLDYNEAWKLLVSVRLAAPLQNGVLFASQWVIPSLLSLNT